MLVRVVISSAILFFFFFSVQPSHVLAQSNCAGNGSLHLPIQDDQPTRQKDSARALLRIPLCDLPLPAPGIDVRSLTVDDSEQKNERWHQSETLQMLGHAIPWIGHQNQNK